MACMATTQPRHRSPASAQFRGRRPCQQLFSAAAAAAIALGLALCCLIGAAAADGVTWPKSAFPFGIDADTSVSELYDQRDDAGWEVDFPDAPMLFYGQQHTFALASDNGYIALDYCWWPYDPAYFGTDPYAVPTIAPFYADISLLATDADGEYAGNLWWRLSGGGSSDATAAAALVARAFPAAAGFTPQKVFIATWDSVLPGKLDTDPPVNPSVTDSFQAAIMWDSKSTYTCFFYPAGGLNWNSATTMSAPAAMGFEEGNGGRVYQLMPSRSTTGYKNLATTGNIGEAGTWCYRVDSAPIAAGTTTPAPTPAPTAAPTAKPTAAPTAAPTKTPTAAKKQIAGWLQCGGIYGNSAYPVDNPWGDSQCVTGTGCIRWTAGFWQCIPGLAPSPAKAPTAAPTKAPTKAPTPTSSPTKAPTVSVKTVSIFAQCGGKIGNSAYPKDAAWGDTKCTSGTSCKRLTDLYWMCLL